MGVLKVLMTEWIVQEASTQMKATLKLCTHQDGKITQKPIILL